MIENSSEINHEKDQFNILLTGYEGPIDLLLDLAKKQKVDLSEISILALAEQYIEYINNYNKIHLEIAADYLVMSAWLTYLKSRLLLPKDEIEDEYSPEELEEALRFQLLRLEAIQKTSKNLYEKPLINRDTFYGGIEEGVKIKYDITYKANLYDILKTYSSLLSKKDSIQSLTIASSELYSVDQAIQRLKNIFGSIKEWTNIMSLLPNFGTNKIINKSSLSSNFVASLELAKNGLIEVNQKEVFGNIYIRSKN